MELHLKKVAGLEQVNKESVLKDIVLKKKDLKKSQKEQTKLIKTYKVG